MKCSKCGIEYVELARLANSGKMKYWCWNCNVEFEAALGDSEYLKHSAHHIRRRDK